MTTPLPSFCLLLWLFYSAGAAGQALSLPLRLDYALLSHLVASQLFTGGQRSAKVWQDPSGCSHLTLADPKIHGDDGQLKLASAADAQVGAKLGGQCVGLLKWSGVLEAWQRPTLSADQAVLTLPVTRFAAYDQHGKPLASAQVSGLIQNVVSEKLAGLRIDLNELRPQWLRTLSRYVPKDRAADLEAMLASLRFAEASATLEHLALTLALTPPARPRPAEAAKPLTATERQRWQALWRNWHGVLVDTINQASQDSPSAQLRGELTALLHELEQAAQAGVSGHFPADQDPVRQVFIRTWERLAPLLRQLAPQLPEARAFEYLGFVAATDLIYHLDAIGSPFGFGISADGLKNLARALVAGRPPATAAPHY